MSINILLTLLSLNAVLVILERVSPTTKIILQPYSFLRVHEVFQMTVVIMLSIIISFLLLKVISNNFETLKSKKAAIIGILFTLGIYFTATGNGAHEIASYFFNTFCDTKHVKNDPCGSMFFNDYYFGNIVYFVGLLFGNISLILLERLRPQKNAFTKDTLITLGNGFIYALTLFAYAAFDRVIIGFIFVAVAAISTTSLLFTANAKPRLLPFTLYCSFAYTLAAIATALVRFR
ncbi:MAG: hypothetical protein HYT83_02245 [Candidatus Levybacteria bacterium]|nr:hypothetical protein [Candidatus Levybacteria bacterium]